MKKKSYLSRFDTRKISSWVQMSSRRFSSGLFLESSGYFDERPVLYISITQVMAFLAMPFLLQTSLWFLLLLPLTMFGLGEMIVFLPIKTGVQKGESPMYGFRIIEGDLVLLLGAKIEVIEFPWKLVYSHSLFQTDYGYWFRVFKSNIKYPKIYSILNRYSVSFYDLEDLSDKNIKKAIFTKETEVFKPKIISRFDFYTIKRQVIRMSIVKNNVEESVIVFCLSKDEKCNTWFDVVYAAKRRFPNFFPFDPILRLPR
jgi:hypothetical protein